MENNYSGNNNIAIGMYALDGNFYSSNLVAIGDSRLCIIVAGYRAVQGAKVLLLVARRALLQ